MTGVYLLRRSFFPDGVVQVAIAVTAWAAEPAVTFWAAEPPSHFQLAATFLAVHVRDGRTFPGSFRR